MPKLSTYMPTYSLFTNKMVSVMGITIVVTYPLNCNYNFSFSYCAIYMGTLQSLCRLACH